MFGVAGTRVLQRYFGDLGKTLCPPGSAGMLDVTQRVAAESSFAPAKSNVKGNRILRVPFQLTIPASRGSCDDLGTQCDTTRRKDNNTTAPIYRCPMAHDPYSTSQHFVTTGRLFPAYVKLLTYAGW